MNETAKQCLFIVYYYPPINNVGKNRTLRFVDSMKKNNRYLPFIHTVRNPDSHVVNVDRIHTSDDNEVCRSYSINLGLVTSILNGVAHRLLKPFGIDLARNPVRRLFFYPDIHIGWIPGCLLSSVRLIKEKKIDLIYVSCSPFSASITGVLLKKMVGLPLVLDFRDPWSFNDNINTNRVSGLIHTLIERWVLKNTDFLIANTRSACDLYKTKYPFLKEKVTYIYNGYNANSSLSRNKSDEFVMLYTGAIYDMEYLDYLFSAVKELYGNKKDIRLIFTGHSSHKAFEYSRKYDLQEVVSAKGFIGSTELHELYSRASILLFYNGFHNNRLKKSVIKSKLFDYMATGIPILALAPEGEHSDLIWKYSPDSAIVSRDFKRGMVSGLCDGYERWENGGDDLKKNNDFLEHFGGDCLTDQLETVFDKSLR